MEDKNYFSFQAADFQMPYTFLFPADWNVSEITKGGHKATFIAKVSTDPGTYTTAFSIRMLPEKAQTPEGALEGFISIYKSDLSFREVGRASGTIAENPAAEVEITYIMPLRAKAVDHQLVQIRERGVFLKRGDQLYELIYSAIEEDYNAYLDCFRILIRTFSFLDEPSVGTFSPLITSSSRKLQEGGAKGKTGEGRKK